MNTDTGRIYDPEEYTELRKLYDANKANANEAQREFAEAMDAGKIVPVSDEVVRLVRAGKSADERKRKRKAARAARKANR